MVRPAMMMSALACAAAAAPAPARDATTSTAVTGSAETLRTARGSDGEIVVTARNYVPVGSISASKTGVPLIQTPQSVSVITRDQIDLLNFVDAQQAVRYAAGVYGENFGPDPRYDFFTVRGFTPKQYIDGLAAPITTTIYSVGVDLYGFQSLDLLKGPSATLYGNSPPGGIYNETSRRASSEFGGEARAQGGTDAFRELAGTVTGAAAPGFDLRVTGLYRDRDLVADHTNTKRVYIAPTATWTIDGRTTLTGLLYYQYDQGDGGQGGFLPVYGTLLANPIGKIGQRTNLGDPRDDFERRQFAAGYEFTHRFSDAISFISNGKWNRYRERTPTGLYDQSGLVNVTDAALPTYFRTISQSNFSYAENVTGLAADNRVSARFDTGAVHHVLLAGVDYRSVDNKAAFGFLFGANMLDAFDPVYAATVARPGYPIAFNDERLKQIGGYMQEQARLGRLFVTLGGRYDHDRITYFGQTTPEHKFTWRAGANYVLPSGIAPYVSYATSFEPTLGTDSVTGRQYKPTTGRQVEGGVKYDARGLGPDFKLFATAAVFDIRQRDVVQTLPSLTPVSGTQSGEVEVYGGELEVVARIRDQLTVNGSYSYNHSKVLKSNVAAEVGAPLPTTPKHKASLFVNYDFQRGILPGLGIGAGVRYTGRSTGGLPGAFNPLVYVGQPSTLFDGIVSYDVPGWRFAVNGSNLLDKRYVARCSGPNGCFYGAPRQVLLTVTKKFR